MTEDARLTTPWLIVCNDAMSESAHNFVEAKKAITDASALQTFLNSLSCASFVAFLEALNESVKGLTSDAPVTSNAVIDGAINALARLGKFVDEIPPIPQAMRYGNKAFQIWIDRMVETSEEMHKSILPESLHDAHVELKNYWIESFGNRTRIDYGTGHETNFVAWLYCLEKLGLWEEVNRSAVVLKIQRTYMLEPAGSHGVWSLDDYHFLPFYFGSSQLRGHPNIKPTSIRNPDIYNTYDKKYMYLHMIKFINEVKTGPFFEHSQILDSIANSVHWDKVNQGMMKMYKGEILGKFPVMQHFFFGSLLPFQ